jgi:hypothetical protein
MGISTHADLGGASQELKPFPEHAIKRPFSRNRRPKLGALRASVTSTERREMVSVFSKISIDIRGCALHAMAATSRPNNDFKGRWHEATGDRAK